MTQRTTIWGLAAATLACLFAVQATAADKAKSAGAELIGRWDLVVQDGQQTYPSWLEIRKSGSRTLVGRFVGQFGSARPIAEIELNGPQFHFSIPPQWAHPHDLMLSGQPDGTDQLKGQLTDEAGRHHTWTAQRAPELQRDAKPKWDAPRPLFNGKDLSGWEPLLDRPNGWTVRDGILYNEKPGNNIATTEKFTDFQLHVEFRYPKGSNSGIYLRGRHEVQIEDNYGLPADSHHIGGVYGFLTPSENAAKPAGEWQTYDITLVGRKVTVLLNGKRILDNQTIPGITGGALDSHEGQPGPIYLQGDHGPVEFRNLTIAPVK